MNNISTNIISNFQRRVEFSLSDRNTLTLVAGTTIICAGTIYYYMHKNHNNDNIATTKKYIKNSTTIYPTPDIEDKANQQSSKPQGIKEEKTYISSKTTQNTDNTQDVLNSSSQNHQQSSDNSHNSNHQISDEERCYMLRQEQMQPLNNPTLTQQNLNQLSQQRSAQQKLILEGVKNANDTITIEQNAVLSISSGSLSPR